MLQLIEYFEKPSKKQQLDKKCNVNVIGLVVTSFDKGGLEQIVLNLYLGYKEVGYKVFLLCQQNTLGVMAEYINQDELLVFHDDENMFTDFILRNHITILHYHYNTYLMDKAKKMGIKVIYTMHNVYTWKNDFEIMEYAEILTVADYVVPVSHFVSNYFIQRTNYKKDNIKIIYNGIRFDNLNTNEAYKTISRENLGVKPNEITLAYIASFYPTKSQIGIIGVMEKIIKKRKDIKILLVGNIGDPRYFEKFMEIYNSSAAKNNIMLIPYFDHKYIGSFLRETVDIFILPTLQEGCSNAVLEAIYCDKPLIISNVGNAEQIKDLKSCIIVSAAYDNLISLDTYEINRISMDKDMSNQQEVIYAIEEMVFSLDEYKSKAKLSLENKQKYSYKYMVNEYCNLIEQLLNKKDDVENDDSTSA